eukprot:TRINITY_DN18094_c0_g1_i1.p1 TRINITY_DN18094_c0_g1~~TRINITY_DN18094_c0_g1_i1.p1  ORF type:complete len:487 (+),score=70.63 TRINITY_DN18094_c0_g1_i1:3-1463(+)
MTNLEKIEQAQDNKDFAVDFGGLTTLYPRAVFLPKTLEQIVDVLLEAPRQKVRVAVRGQGHSTGGQPLVEDGFVINLRHYNKIGSIETGTGAGTGTVWVESGATWREVLNSTLDKGWTPPVLTDYLDLSIGGTLSVGGVGAQTFKHGLQTDNVYEIQVVTGKGEVKTCSPTVNTDLFDAVRAGLGQFGIITRAKLKLIAAPQYARFHRLFFSDMNLFYEALTTLVSEDSFDGIQGFAVMNDLGIIQMLINQYPNEVTGTQVDQMDRSTRKWLYMIELGESYSRLNDSKSLNESNLKLTKRLDEFSTVRSGRFVWEMSYREYLGRLTKPMEDLRAFGLWNKPHPWINLMVSGENAPAFITEALSNIDPNDAGTVLIYPYLRDRLRTPLFCLPDGESGSRHVIKLGLLRTAPNQEQGERLTRDNRDLYETCLNYGGTRYPVGSVPMGPGDWSRQFRKLWPVFVGLKAEYDPLHLLAPQQGIFEDELIT